MKFNIRVHYSEIILRVAHTDECVACVCVCVMYHNKITFCIYSTLKYTFSAMYVTTFSVVVKFASTHQTHSVIFTFVASATK